uniref:Voltage-dependent anion-selective channel protein 3 n=1 Tax=Parascaris equorum TaxID=6256 RepID=A0A914S068_PAREQ
MLGTIIEIQDQFARGLKLTLDSSYAPQVGKRTGKVKAEWAAESAKNVEVGAQLGWTVGDQGARFALAAKYCPAKDLELKAKVDNQSKVALAATHHLSNQVLLCSIFVVVVRVGRQKLTQKIFM